MSMSYRQNFLTIHIDLVVDRTGQDYSSCRPKRMNEGHSNDGAATEKHVESRGADRKRK